MGGDDPPTLEDYLADLQETTNGKNTIYGNMPENPLIDDLLVPDTTFTHDGRTYYKRRVYKYTEGGTWEEVDYANTGVVNSLRNEVIGIGNRISNTFNYKTELGDDYIISPAIGGGYLNISGKPDINVNKMASVILDPSNMSGNNQIF
jgi:hypothetical protein